MRNIPVWGKIALGLAGASILTLVITAGGYLGLLRTEAALRETARRRMPAQESLGTLRNALTAIQRAERTMLIEETSQNPAETARQNTNRAKFRAQAEDAFSAYEALPVDRTVDRTVDPAWLELKDAWQAWLKRHDKVLELLAADMRMGAMALSMREAREALLRVEAALDAMQARERSQAEAFVAQALPQARHDRLLLLAASALALLTSL
ncbi:MAG: MCP four helix bundle domain-containing protein, partial [Humidesulfovibrio sp.]|nr:MCP four helix bundle domain-containing protein [Humidesulfovibrio sp.]